MSCGDLRKGHQDDSPGNGHQATCTIHHFHFPSTATPAPGPVPPTVMGPVTTTPIVTTTVAGTPTTAPGNYNSPFSAESLLVLIDLVFPEHSSLSTRASIH